MLGLEPAEPGRLVGAEQGGLRLLREQLERLEVPVAGRLPLAGRVQLLERELATVSRKR